MKRHVSLLACALLCIAMVLTLVACNGNAHQHTFSDEWSYNETNHWHAATCTEEGCGTAKGSDLAHADKDNNKVCDVCGYDYDHEHTYAEETSSDAKSHWYAVTCGCTIDTNKDDHVDNNNDGTCDLCKYNGGHEHTVNEEAWAYDQTNHWNVVECGHSVEEKEAHDYDEVGVCSVCGYLEGDIDVESAVAMGDYYKDLTNGATVAFEYDTYGVAKQNLITYVLGNMASNITIISTDYEGNPLVEDGWYMLNNGSIFGVIDDGESIYAPYDPDSAIVNGYAFNEVFGYDGGDDTRTYYGVNDLVVSLYELAKTFEAEEYVMVVDGVAVYTFEFDYEIAYQDWEGNYECSVYKISVGFSLSEDYTYESVVVSSAKYMAEAVLSETESEDEEPELLYIEVTTLVPTTVRNYTALQTTGERDLEFKYPPESTLVSEYELLDGEDNAVESISVVAGSYTSYSFGNVSPDTAILALNVIDVFSDDGLSVNYWDGAVSIYAGAPGDYTFVVSMNGTETTYNVTVTVPPVSEIWATVDGNPVADSGINVYSANNTATVTFGAAVNSYANGAYTAMLGRMDMMSNTLTDNGDGTYTLTMNTDMGGYASVQVMLQSTENSEVTYILTVNAIPAPTIDQILTGTYEAELMDDRFNWYGFNDITVVFTPTSSISGSFTINLKYDSMWGGEDYTDTYTYIYDEANGKLITTFASTDMPGSDTGMGLTVTYDPATYQLSVEGMNGAAVLEASSGSSSTLKIAGEYRYNVYDDNYSLVSCYQLIINADGTGTFKYRTWNRSSYTWTDEYTTTFTWEEADNGGFTVSVADYTYLQNGTYSYGNWVGSYEMEGIVGVVVLEGTTPAVYNFELNQRYD